MIAHKYLDMRYSTFFILWITSVIIAGYVVGWLNTPPIIAIPVSIFHGLVAIPKWVQFLNECEGDDSDE